MGKSLFRNGNPRKPARTGRTVTVGRAEDLPDGRGATVELEDGSELALFNSGGTFYAVENYCPHRGAPLAEGSLCGRFVECDLHNWRFDLQTGECLTADAPIESYAVKIENGEIKIEI